MGNFSFFQLIRNYAKTTRLNDEKYISQEASYTAQQNLQGLSLQKIWVNCLKFVLSADFGFYIVQITFLDYQAKIFSIKQVFRKLTLLKLCWALKEA